MTNPKYVYGSLMMRSAFIAWLSFIFGISVSGTVSKLIWFGSAIVWLWITYQDWRTYKILKKLHAQFKKTLDELEQLTNSMMPSIEINLSELEEEEENTDIET